MLEVTNVRVYDLKESVIACRNAMRTEPPVYTDEEFEASLVRAKKLVRASGESPNVKCHDNFLTGIRVSFDLKYTQYITKQFQRYHWFDYVSSSSMMHRLVKMDPDKACNKYVSEVCVKQLKEDIHIYNQLSAMEPDKLTGFYFYFRDGTYVVCRSKGDALYHAYMRCISDCPMGTELFVRVSTNYKQLQTIYWQRKDHKLREDWGAFIKFVESLPYADELIIGREKTENND